MPADIRKSTHLAANLRRELKAYALERMPRAARVFVRDLRRGGKVRRIRDLAALDVALREAYEAFQVSEDEGRRVLDGIELVVNEPRPRDPASSAYRDHELALYTRLTGKPYTPASERSIFDLAEGVRSPFPYRTRTPEVVGDQLILLGFLLKAVPMPPPARILEFGPGWGNTTQALLQTGYDVTAAEIDPAFIELIAQRCALHPDRLTLERADMLEFTSTQRFDVILFFESFHHCQDHRRLLRQLHDLLAEGGVILFVAEPIVDLPYPWGLRLDGQSLWAMRQLGWLELGFDRSYFMQALRDTGWVGERLHSRAISSLTDVVVARAAN
ncbi:MAG: class I SAM-dependent methyltransferase [Chloroflexota bacterium]|nr:class I SAM-dependent methyltransferase [Chloroflexota bacterium]